MKIVTAPEKYSLCKSNLIQDRPIGVFLAGGITDCQNWQRITIEKLSEEFSDWHHKHAVILNPRREEFPINDPYAAREQITWEFKALEQCHIYSMYLCTSRSVQPICMYELGRNLCRMEHKYRTKDDYRYEYSGNWKTACIVSVEDGYSRAEDVRIQCELAGVQALMHASPMSHAMAITKAMKDLYGYLG